MTPSETLASAVNEFSQLPSIGNRTAMRLVLFLLKQPVERVQQFSESINNLTKNIRYCKICHNISDQNICQICSSHSRERSIICLVEDIRDVLAVENTGLYNGLYHVLGGKISPINGIGPDSLNIESLKNRINKEPIEEIIFALSPTTEGDTTGFYINKIFNDKEIKTSIISSGIAVGDELEFTDEVTLGRSIVNRVPFSTKIEF